MSQHKLEIVRGAQGLAVYLNDRRISGRDSKPLGGGETVKSWRVSDDDIREAMKNTD